MEGLVQIQVEISFAEAEGEHCLMVHMWGEGHQDPYLLARGRGRGRDHMDKMEEVVGL